MYVVRNSNNVIVAICTLKADADAFQSGGAIDKEFYSVEDMSEDAIIKEYFLQIEDGIGEGQSW